VSDPNSRAAGTDGRILLVTVTDVQFPVTLEVVYQVKKDFLSSTIVFQTANKLDWQHTNRFSACAGPSQSW
jgi:hypothetical protein